jgi:iron complex outermembrane receptor protein
LILPLLAAGQLEAVSTRQRTGDEADSVCHSMFSAGGTTTMSSNNHYKTALLAAASMGIVATEQAAAQDIGEVVVTARRMEERLQDVPISITVFNQDQIDDRNVTTLTDLATYTPSLQTNSEYASPSTASFSIRGFVQDSFTSPSVGIYFADVISPRGASSLTSGDGAGPGSMFDLQNVQVLKGPQGTLFGRNTTGGAVLLVPQRPTYELEGYLEGSVGNFDMNRLQGVLNVPLGNQARARVGFDRMTREGHWNNISDVGPRHFGDVDYFAARASFVLDMAPNLENYSILSYSQSNTNGGLSAVVECSPVELIGYYSCAQVERYNAANDFYAVENAAIDPYNNQDQWQFINTTTWDISDNLTFKNILSYAEVRNEVNGAIFGNSWLLEGQPDPRFNGTEEASPGSGIFIDANTGGRILPFGSLSAPGIPFNHASTFTEEIQFQGAAFDNRLTWQAGAYYEAVEQIPARVGSQGAQFGSCDRGMGWDPEGQVTGFPVTGIPTNIDSSCTFFNTIVGQALDPGGLPVVIAREVRTSAFYDQAVYAQGTYAFTDRLSATLGLRYTDDRSEATAVGHTFVVFEQDGEGIFGGTPEREFIFTSVRCTDPEADLPSCSRNFSQHSNATTGEISLGYQATDNINTYVKYARGYRQGLVSPRGVGFLSSFDQEQVDLYEVGVKANWAGAAPGYLNVAVFHNDFQNQQLQLSYANDAEGGAPASGICACGESVIDGVELDGAISLFEGFRLAGGVAYLDTELKDATFPLVGPEGWSVLTTNPNVGQPLAFAPELKGSITAAYTLPLSENVGEVTLAATYSYTDQYYLREAVIPSYDLLNLNVSWDGVLGSPVDLSLFATNVTDEEYIVANNNSLLESVGFRNVVTGEPQMYGMRLRYNFGADAN